MDDQFEFYKEVYFFEHNRKDSLSNAHSTPIGLITVLLGVIGFYINDLLEARLPLDWLFIIFALLLLSSVALIIRAFAVLISSFTGNAYDYVPYLKDLYQFEIANKAFHEGNENEEIKDWSDNLKKSLTDAAHTNCMRNHERSKKLFIAKKSLAWSAMVIAISAVPYFISKAINSDSNIEEPTVNCNFKPEQEKTLIMMPEEDNTPANEPAETQPAKPQFPTNVTIVEGESVMPSPDSTNITERGGHAINKSNSAADSANSSGSD